ncbi:MAG: hypothetical protein ACE5H0_15475 [Bacteroidota bacterium]
MKRYLRDTRSVKLFSLGGLVHLSVRVSYSDYQRDDDDDHDEDDERLYGTLALLSEYW